MVDIKDLEAFLRILDGGSISNAAEAMHLTQPALSLKLKKMEVDLGVQLFQRTPRNVVALETAKVIAPAARDILMQLESLKEILANNVEELKGVIRVGCLTGWVDSLLLPVSQAVKETAPLVRLRMHVAQTYELIDMVSHGKLDFAILAQPFEKMEGVETEYLLDEKLALIGHQLPHDLTTKQWREYLLQRPWVTMTVPDPLVDKWWREHFSEPFPWNEVQVPCSLEYITKLPTMLMNYPDAVAVIPRQIVQPYINEGKLEKSDLVSKRNQLYVMWRHGGIELRRYAVVKDAIVTHAKGLMDNWVSERAMKRAKKKDEE